jgi:hypothetical protein
MNILLLLLLFYQVQSPAPINVYINPRNDTEANFLLSDFAKAINYIKLQTSDLCVVSSISKILIDDEKIFVKSPFSSFYRLLLFSSDGTFLNEIGRSGRGPGEYATVLDFAIDRSRKIVYILDSMGKVLIYDYKGKYLDTILITSKPSGILFTDESLVLLSAWPDYYLNKGFAIQIKELSGSKNDVYLFNRKSVEFKRGQGVVSNLNYFYTISNNSTLIFFEDKFDTLYSVNSKFAIEAELVFHLKDDLPKDLLTVSDYTNALKSHNCLSDFIKVKNHLFFKIITPNPVITYYYHYDIETGKTEKHNVTNDRQYFFNDIDGGITFKPIGIAEEGVLYTYFDCYKLKDHLAGINNRKTRINDKVKYEYLKGLIQNSDVNDNPIIILVTLK